jgi:hypothetical protein
MTKRISFQKGARHCEMSKAKRGNLKKSVIYHEIAAVILFLRNDSALFL